MKFITIKTLLLLVLIVFGNFFSIAQDTPEQSEKGNFYNISINTLQSALYYKNSIYEVRPAHIKNTWEMEGWSFDETNNMITTGRYPENASLTLTSPAISLPEISFTEGVYLLISETFSLESDFDFGRVLISEDDSTWVEIARSSGRSSGRENRLNLSEYAGKDISIKLQLTSDSTIQGTGWSVHNINIVQASLVDETPNYLKSRSLNKSVDDEKEVRIIAVHEAEYPDAVYVDFEYYVNGEFSHDFDLSMIQIFEDDIPQDDCLRLWRGDDLSMTRPVDVVFLIDNSGSMGSVQNQIKTRIVQFTQNLRELRDCQFALVNFGQSANSGFPINIEISNSIYFTSDIAEFQTVLNTNLGTTGSNEPGYDAIVSGASLPFRQNAEKVFILVTDENPIDDNFNQNFTLETTLPIALRNDIRVFGVLPEEEEFVQSYGVVIGETGGRSYNLYGDFVQSLTEDLTSVVSNKYTLRYCPAQAQEEGPICIELGLITDDVVSNKSCFDPQPRPSINRDVPSQIYDVQPVPEEGMPVQLGVIVTDTEAPYPIEVRLFYRQLDSDDPLKNIVMTEDVSSSYPNKHFICTIPSDDVNHPGFKYYVVATYADGSELRTPSAIHDFNMWTVAVMPNVPPVITETDRSDAIKYSDITIDYTVTDTTNTITDIIFYYRELHSPGVYQSEVIDFSETTEYSTSSTIPSSFTTGQGVEFYIKAIDNFGAMGFYGTAENPNVILLPDDGCSLSINLEGNDAPCTGRPGSITASITGGSGSYTYEWYVNGVLNSSTTNVISGLAVPGNYDISLKVVDIASSCYRETQQTISLDINNNPISVNTTFGECNNNGIILISANATGGSGNPANYSYSWTPDGVGSVLPNWFESASGSRIIGESNQSYTVVVTDNTTGCTASSTTSPVNCPCNLTAYVQSNPTDCDGSTGSVISMVRGASGAYTYSWSGGQSSANISGLSYGAYTLTVSDANNSSCYATADAIVTNNCDECETRPITIDENDITTTSTYCSSQNGTVSIGAISGVIGDVMYQWHSRGVSMVSTQKTKSGLDFGPVGFTVVDSRGCFASTARVIQRDCDVPPPSGCFTMDVSRVQANCDGTGGSLTANTSIDPSGVNFLWLDIFARPVSLSQTLSTDNLGIYSVIAVDKTNAECVRRTSEILTRRAECCATDLTITDLTATPTDCNASNGSIAVSVSGSAPFAYLWRGSGLSFPIPAQNLVNVGEGNYRVFVADANFCEIESDYVYVAERDCDCSNSDLSVRIIRRDPSCLNNDGQLTAQVTGGDPSYRYSWSNTRNSVSRMNGLSAGRYTLTVTDANDCQKTVSANLTEPYPCDECIEDCLPSFMPQFGYKYVVTAWVKQDEVNEGETYSDAYLELLFEDGSCSNPEDCNPRYYAAGPIIDGWQQIQGVFIMPYNTKKLFFKMEVNPSSTVCSKAYFDDIRIHPFNSNMKSFVYDPVSQRLMAELDENNYATYYEYDEEGALVRVKKETVRGVKTIQESRNNSHKKGIYQNP